MSKGKKLDPQHKALLKSKAWSVVAKPDKYLKGASEEQKREFKEEVQKNQDDVHKAVYKSMKRDATAQLNGKELNQEEDHGLHIFEKVKFVAKGIAHVLHKLITPFIPIFTAIATDKVTQEVMNHPDIPQDYKDDLAAASGQVIGKVGSAVENLDLAGDNAGDNLSASVLGDNPAEEAS